MIIQILGIVLLVGFCLVTALALIGMIQPIDIDWDAMDRDQEDHPENWS